MRDINGKTRTCGLIGNPVEHTLSPIIHNTLAEDLGIDMAYVPFLVEVGQLSCAAKGAYALNLLGCNVTVPYKNDIISELMEIDELAAKIGAVNTLVRVEGGFKGYNTDMTGLLRAMKSDNVTLEGEDVIILGAGGVGRAVAYMCAAYGAKKIYLLNRTLDKAQMVAQEVNENTGRDCVEALRLSDYQTLEVKKYVVIQCTSIGMYPKSEEVVIDDEAFYDLVKVGYDLIYTPWETQFMSKVKAHGAEAYNGLKMLLYQGVEAFELWNGCKVPDESAYKVYELMKVAVTSR